MDKFPIDAPKQKVIAAFKKLGFRVVRDKEHVSMIDKNADGTETPLTMPSHPKIKSSTLRTICQQSGISRDEFLKASK